MKDVNNHDAGDNDKREEYNSAVKNRAGNFDPEFFPESGVRPRDPSLQKQANILPYFICQKNRPQFL